MRIGKGKPITVLVTEGENRSSLAVIRSLGNFVCKVVVTGATGRKIWPHVLAIAQRDMR